MASIRAQLIISGRVQGVYFRYSTQEEAARLGGLTGMVRNLKTGDVEVVVEGEENQVGKLIAWCHHGPPGAKVEDVAQQTSEPTGEFSRFMIAY